MTFTYKKRKAASLVFLAQSGAVCTAPGGRLTLCRLPGAAPVVSWVPRTALGSRVLNILKGMPGNMSVKMEDICFMVSLLQINDKLKKLVNFLLLLDTNSK